MSALPFAYAITFKHGGKTDRTEISVDREIADRTVIAIADSIARDLDLPFGSVEVLGYELVRSPGGAA